MMLALYNTPENHVNILLHNSLKMQLLSANNTLLWMLIELKTINYK